MQMIIKSEDIDIARIFDGLAPERRQIDCVALYADGGVIQRNPSEIGGTWAYCLVNSAGERIEGASGLILPDGTDYDGAALYYPGREITNNVTEFFAVTIGLAVLASYSPGWCGEVCSDSRCTILRQFAMAKTNGLDPRIIAIAAAARSRLGTLTPVLCKGHPTREMMAEGRHPDGRRVSEHNVWCDKACGEQADRYVATLAANKLPAPAIMSPAIA